MGWKSIAAGALLIAIATPAWALDIDALAPAFNAALENRMKGVATRVALERCNTAGQTGCDYNAGPHVHMSAQAATGRRAVSHVVLTFDMTPGAAAYDWQNAVRATLMVFSPDASDDEIAATVRTILERVVQDPGQHNPTQLHGVSYQAGEQAGTNPSVWFTTNLPE